MKRGQEDGDSASPTRNRKNPFHRTDELINLLDMLHDDEFKHVLSYLDVKAKGNLKQTSKDYDKRVFHLDPAMRTWKITFGPDNWEKDGMVLSKAKAKHTQDGNIEKIKLFLRFYRPDYGNFGIQFLAENVINNWKNNIVHLKITISGLELFLLDEELKMPYLHSLSLVANDKLPEDWENPPLRDVSKIVNFLLERQKDTVKVLEWSGLDTLGGKSAVDVSIPLELKLKELKVKNISSRNLVLMLKTSQLTLENFECDSFYYLEQVPREELIELESFQLQLTKFKVALSQSYLIGAVLRSSRSTLKQFELEEMVLNEFFYVQGLELGEIQLGLTSFTAHRASSQHVIEVIKASKSTLKNLTLDECYVFEDEFKQSVNKLELYSLKATGRTPLSFIFLILCNTNRSIKDIDIDSYGLYDIDDEPIDEDEYISLLNYISFDNLKKLNCSSAELFKAIINGSESSLRSLETEVNAWQAEDVSFKIKENSLKLKELNIKGNSPHIVSTIINSTNSTLEHLILEGGCYDAYNRLDQGLNLLPEKLKLKSFTGKEVSASVIKTVLESSTTLFNAIEIVGGGQTKGMPIELDSETTQMLHNIKSRNPFCCVKLSGKK